MESLLLDKDVIWSGLSQSTQAQINYFDLFSEIDSTNKWVYQKMLEGGRGGFLCLSEQQNAGRGRNNRNWYSPFAENIYLSWGCAIHRPIVELSNLSLVIGYVLANAIKKLGIQNVALKWPNDLLIGEKKIAGVLIEVVNGLNSDKDNFNGDNLSYVVIGVGINVNMRSDQNKINTPWGSLISEVETQDYDELLDSMMVSHGEERIICRNSLAKLLITDIIESVINFSEFGFKGYQDLWSKFDFLADKLVYFYDGQKEVAAIGRGINTLGEYLVDIGGRIKNLRSGEVRIRPRKKRACH